MIGRNASDLEAALDLIEARHEARLGLLNAVERRTTADPAQYSDAELEHAGELVDLAGLNLDDVTDALAYYQKPVRRSGRDYIY
jgi:hypothetical protein